MSPLNRLLSRNAHASNPRANQQQIWRLKDKLFRLSVAGDTYTFGDQVRSSAKSGNPQSGKTSTQYEAEQEACWMANHSGVVLAYKADTAERAMRIAKLCGQGHRIAHMKYKSKWRFNPVQWRINFERQRIGGLPARAGSEAINSMLEVLYRGRVQTQQHEFFGPAGENLNHKNSVALTRGSGVCGITELIGACRKMPESEAAFDFPEKYPVLRALKKLRERGEWDLECDDLLSFYKQHAGLADETRTSVEMGLATRLTPLTEEPMLSVFFEGETNITPEIVDRDNLIWIVDFPVVHYGSAGTAINAAVMEACVTYAMTRPDSDRTRPYGIFLDEGFALATDKLLEGIEKGRSARMYCSITYQNLHTAVNGFGGNKEKAIGVLASCGMHGWFSQSDKESREWSSGSVGQIEEWVPSIHQDAGGVKWGYSKQYRPALPEEKMLGLVTGRDTLYATCYLFDSRKFKASNRRFLLTRWYRPGAKRWRWWETFWEPEPTARPWSTLPQWYRTWREVRESIERGYRNVREVFRATTR